MIEAGKNKNVESVLVTSTFPDTLNSNLAIRNYVFHGFKTAYPNSSIFISSIDVAASFVKTYAPQLVIAIGSLAVDGVDYYSLRRACDSSRSHLAFWLHDDPYEFDYSFKAIDIANTIFTNDLWTLEHYLHPNVYHLPLAGCPDTHYIPIEEDKKRSIDLFFCGVAYPNRIEILRQSQKVLDRFNIVVRGDHWPKDIKVAKNKRLTSTMMAKYAASSKVTLNIGRDFNIANSRYAIYPSTPGPRTFEIALAGSAQLYFVDSLEIQNYFELDKEIILFDSIRDIQSTLERALDEPEYLSSIARNAQLRALNEHCYSHRATKIIDTCM